MQVSLAVITMHWSWPSYLAVVYIVGATANHSLFLAIHELSHNLGFKSIAANKLCSMLANLPIGIPYCITFKPYHMEHHRFQGDHGELLEHLVHPASSMCPTYALIPTRTKSS
jgi:sphingolipid delta-4 desaturase